MSNLLTSDVLEALRPTKAGLTLIITVGNVLRGDDGIGPYIATQVSNPKRGLRILDAADRPEDCLDAAASLHPAKTVVIDAADFGGEPGEARIVPQELIPETTISTHTFPLKIITRMIEEETGSTVFFLGIQPQDMNFGQGLSDPVRNTADAIVRVLKGRPRHA